MRNLRRPKQFKNPFVDNDVRDAVIPTRSGNKKIRIQEKEHKGTDDVMMIRWECYNPNLYTLYFAEDKRYFIEPKVYVVNPKSHLLIPHSYMTVHSSDGQPCGFHANYGQDIGKGITGEEENKVE